MAATTQAREIYIDQGEKIDIVQILGLGGIINSGQTWNNLFYGQATAVDNLSLTSNNQTTGFQITVPYVRVATVNTAGNSVTLPPSMRGMAIVVVNDDPTVAGKAMNVFPAVGDAINALAVNAAYSLNNTFASVSPGVVTIFICYSTGLWRTK